MSADQVQGRLRFMDAQRVNLDGFAEENAALGLIAMASPARKAPPTPTPTPTSSPAQTPAPTLVIQVP